MEPVHYPIPTWEVGEQVMPTVAGRPFRCECGGNVFTRQGEYMKFKCNSCGALYEGEKSGVWGL